MDKSKKSGLFFLIGGLILASHPIYKILTQDLSRPFIGPLTLSIVAIIVGISKILKKKKNHNRDRTPHH
jgi:hypothetical protein